MNLSTGSIIFLDLAFAVYVFMIIDRICKCFEQCAMNKSIGKLYERINDVDVMKILSAVSKQKASDDGR